jgi:hypothetical protein
MSTISVDQRFALLSTLGAKTRWERLTPPQVQLGIAGSAEELDRIGDEFTAFVESGFRLCIGNFLRDTGELSIPIPALPRPTLYELRNKYPQIEAKGGIERDDSPTTAVTLKLGSVLIPGEEENVDGMIYEQRLLIPRRRGLLLGHQQAIWVMEHQQEFPELIQLLGKIYIDFPGLIVVRSDGSRDVFCLRSFGKRWYLGWRWLQDNAGSHARTAFSGK